MGDYQEELARLQLADRKKLERKKEKEDKEMEGCLNNCGCTIAVVSVIFFVLFLMYLMYGK